MARILRKLGHGAFGDVYLLQLDNGNEFALKKADTRKLKDSGNSKEEAEAKLMQKLCHAHLVQCCDHFTKGSYLYLITELCRYGTIKSYLRDRTTYVKETRVLKWLGQMTDALRYLHVCKVIHRDMKPDNVFLDDRGNVKVGDLGIARELDYTAQKAGTFIGTMLYMSPEVLSGSPYTYKTDIWSLGCCIHEVMTGRPTFSAMGHYEVMKKITQGKIPSMPEVYHKDLHSLVHTILDTNPDTRPDALEILCSVSKLQGHPFRAGDHTALGRISVSKEAVIKAVKDYELSHTLDDDDDTAPLQQLPGTTQTGSSEEKEESSEEDTEDDSDNDTVVHNTVRAKPRPLPQPRGASNVLPGRHRNAEGAKKEDLVKHRKERNGMKSMPEFQKGQVKGSDRNQHYAERKHRSSSSSSSGEENGAGDDLKFTFQPTEANQIADVGMSSDYMDLLTRESRQWLRTRFAPKDRRASVSDDDSSSDSESLVTLYTRAQAVRYDNRKAKRCNLDSEVSQDVIDAAEAVIKMFAENKSQMETHRAYPAALSNI